MFTISGSVDSTYVNTYIITVHAYDYASTASEHNTDTITLSLIANKGPSVDTPATDPSAIVAHYALDYSVPMSYYSDPEGDDLNFSFRVNDTLGSWIAMTENTTHINFAGTPMNFQVGLITLSIVIKDNQTTTYEAVDDVTITVNENQIPYLEGTPTAPSSQIVGSLWSYDFNFDWMDDYELEVLSHSCSSSPADGWMT
jgi:hypothetical protein